MPIYAYVCTACGHELDKLQKVSDAPLRTCSACGQESLRKKVTAAAFRLKGSGWYETDFKKPKQAPAEKSDTSAASTPAADKSDSGEKAAPSAKSDTAGSDSSDSAKTSDSGS